MVLQAKGNNKMDGMREGTISEGEGEFELVNNSRESINNDS